MVVKQKRQLSSWKNQWTNHNDTPAKRNPEMVINEEVDIDTERIQMKELDTTIKHLKCNKAPGPDKCTTELFKLLSRDTKRILLQILNRIWDEEKAPEVFLDASVASLFKKRRHRRPC